MILFDMAVAGWTLDRSSVRVTSTPDAATHHNRHVKPRYVHFLPSIANGSAVLQGPSAQRLSLNIKRVFTFPLNQKTEAQPCPHCRVERASEGHLKDSICRWGGGDKSWVPNGSIVSSGVAPTRTNSPSSYANEPGTTSKIRKSESLSRWKSNLTGLQPLSGTWEPAIISSSRRPWRPLLPPL